MPSRNNSKNKNNSTDSEKPPRRKIGAFSRNRSNHHTKKPSSSSSSSSLSTSPSSSRVSPPPSTASPSQTFDCAICAESAHIFAVRECGHNQICWMCTLRMLVFKEGRKCPVCKTDSEKIVLTPDPNKMLSEFDLSSLFYDQEWNLYASTQYIMDQVLSLRLFQCQSCGEEFSDLNLLKTHSHKKHRLYYCDLCLKHRQQFLPEQTLFTQKQLDHHLNQGDNSPGFGTGVREGHPWCAFCEEHFYDDEHIFGHMEEKHFWCHLCESNEMHVRFYQDYPSLEDHFDRSHYLCTHIDCRGLFKVFNSEIELAIHEQENHVTGKKSKNKRLQLDLGYGEQNHLDRVRHRVQQENQERRENTVLTANSIIFMGAGDTGPLPQRRPKRRFVSKASHRGPSSIQSNGISSQHTSSHSAFIPLPPDELRSRTKAMMQNMKETLNDENAFEDFRDTSKLFQEGKIKASAYYLKFVELFGQNDVSDRIFDELVTLLPHEDKKQALLMAKNTYQSGEYDSLYKTNKPIEVKAKTAKDNNKQNNRKEKNPKKQENKNQTSKRKKKKDNKQSEKQSEKQQKNKQKKQKRPSSANTPPGNQKDWPSLGAGAGTASTSAATFAAVSKPEDKQKSKQNPKKKKNNKPKTPKLSNNSEYPSLGQSVRLAKSASNTK